MGAGGWELDTVWDLRNMSPNCAALQRLTLVLAIGGGTSAISVQHPLSCLTLAFPWQQLWIPGSLGAE